MSTYVGSRGGVYRGNAPAEDCEAMERWNARCELGAEIKAKVAGYGAQSALARACGVTPACISNVLDGSRAPSADLVEKMADHLGADDATRDRWLALAGRIPTDIAAALLAQPEQWGDVRALLAGRRP